VWQLAGEPADDWRMTARELQDPDDRAQQRKWATTCESFNVIRNAVALAAAHPRMITPAHLLDRHPLKFPVRNGVVDLQAGRLITEPEREWLLTRGERALVIA